MCGIAGRIGSGQPLSEKRLNAVYRALGRRGPDQRGYSFDAFSELIHTRLAVIDVKHGRQPMRLRVNNEEYTLVYNGELYNTEELRSELRSLGHSFTEKSDTEVLLHAYAEWKQRCVEKLNGIFAFAVWERNSKKLFLARDRIGVKPLFYHLAADGTFAFASEIPALLELGIEPELDAEGVAELLFLAPGRTPGCGVLRGIREVLPASRGYFGSGRLTLEPYWQLSDREHRDSFRDTVLNVRELVTGAVKRQLVSDVPVCTFLSGGLDSSAITSIAHRELGELHSFSVDYEDNAKFFKSSKFQPNPDSDYIGKVADYLGDGLTHHSVILNTADLADALYEAAEARGLPGMADVDSSLLLFCREIKKFATVGLSGECADEIFGGYPWYRDPDLRSSYGFPWAQSNEYRAGFIHPDYGGLNVGEYVNMRYENTLKAADILPGTPDSEKRFRQLVRLNFDWFMQTLLDRKDRMSMYSGLEVRVPFCDHNIAEYLYSVPWDMKDFQGREKGLLREALRGLLPDEVLWRKKSPYPKTHHPEYLAAVRKMLSEVPADAPLYSIVRREAITELLNGGGSETPWYGQLMTAPQTIAYFVQLNYWLEHFKVRLV